MNSARDTLAGGLPHSEIPGSTIARISPGLFAACHVLHRLSVPRHPPDALTLRLSATPNGKDHPMPDVDTAGRISRSQPARPAAKPLRCQKTLRRGSPRAARRTPSQDTASRPHAVSRYGHTTRFFTIVNQQHAPAAHQGAAEGNLGFFSPRRAPVGTPIAGELRGDRGALSPEVEVIGIEPTTPCLQSRCSPS